MAFQTDTSTLDVVERWPYDFQNINRDDDLYAYLGVYANELQRLDAFLDELYEQRYVATATGRELEKLGAEVGVTRRSGEGDDSYALRVALGKAIAASDGTANDIATILGIVFTDDVLEASSVEHLEGDPITQFTIPSDAIDDIPLTRQQLEDELERAFPCGFAVEIITDDSWLLGESGSQGLGEGSLT